jgi:hypothetical protein
MKTLTPIFAAVLVLCSQAIAAETSKPTVSLDVKRHLTGTDHDQLGVHGDAKDKIVTLRVAVTNITSAVIEGAELSGNVLVQRGVNEREKIVKETLASVKLPSMKPNETVTIDLGEITLRKVEWKNHKFEESLEEWKVTCKQGDKQLGQNLSSPKYATLEKKVEPLDEPMHDRRNAIGPDPRKRRPFN